MIKTRQLESTDFKLISGFAQTAEELFYIAPFAEYPWHPEKFAHSISERLANTVFVINNTVAGFANFYDFEFADSAFIGNVIVNPAMRRQGIGKLILQHMIESGFSEHKFREIHLSCFSGNTAGLLLYRKLGFKPYGIEQRTDYKNEAVALVNFKLTEVEYQNAQSGFDFNQVATKLADI